MHTVTRTTSLPRLPRHPAPKLPLPPRLQACRAQPSRQPSTSARPPLLSPHQRSHLWSPCSNASRSEQGCCGGGDSVGRGGGPGGTGRMRAFRGGHEGGRGEGGGGGGQGGGGGGGGEGGGFPRWALMLPAACVGYLASLFAGSSAVDLWFSLRLPRLDTARCRISVIVPALNEEHGIRGTIQKLQQLHPPVHEIIVVDGGSTDRTVLEAQAAGAQVVTLGCRVQALRESFADPRTVLVGQTPSIEHDGHKLILLSAHNFCKTWYGPLVFQPGDFVQGLRLLFGDQAISCRATDFRALGGYDARLPIMEDASLCLRLHAAGPSGQGQAGAAYQGRGRVRMLLGHTAITSGRRLIVWGPAYATYVHALISVRWYFGASYDELHQLYQRLYTDVYR